MHGREIHRRPRAQRRSVGRHCFARNPRDARDAEGSPVGREHERVRSRRDVRTCLALPQATKAPTGITIPMSTFVSPDHFVLLKREAGAVALASRAQEMQGQEVGAIALALPAQAMSRNVGLIEGGGAGLNCVPDVVPDHTQA